MHDAQSTTVKSNNQQRQLTALVAAAALARGGGGGGLLLGRGGGQPGGGGAQRCHVYIDAVAGHVALCAGIMMDNQTVRSSSQKQQSEADHDDGQSNQTS